MNRMTRQPQPNERLFEFLANETRWRAELRNNGLFGVEVLFIKDEEVVRWRRFNYRVQAMQWAEIERSLITNERRFNCTYIERTME